MLSTFSSKALDGTGMLGKKVAYVSGDTQTKTDAARAAAKSMIEKDGAIMISGGSSSGVAVGLQALCQDAGLIYMCGLTHSNDTTGKDKKRNGFRLFFNAYMSAAALAPVLKGDYGADRAAYHLTADYTWGWTQQASMQAATEAIGWKTVANVLTPLAATDFSSYIAPVLNSGADVLVLNHYGGNMVNSLTQAVQFGLRDKTVNGKQFQIVVPLISELMAKGAGANIKGIPGSSNWNWKLAGRRHQGFRQVLWHRIRHAAQPGGAGLLRADPALCRCGGTREKLQPLRRGRGPRRLRVRRSGQRADLVPQGRPSGLQGRARGEGQGKARQRVRHARSDQGHPGRRT